MAFQAKFTMQRGKGEIADVSIEAGDAEAQSDTISVNCDVTDLTKGEALIQIDKIREAIHAADWPPLA